MTAGKNYNIQTVIKKLPAATMSAVSIGGAVAASMTRYVTYVKLNQTGIATAVGSKVWLCSVSVSQRAITSGAANTAAKIILSINRSASTRKDRSVAVPDDPDPENPLFTIAASKLLTATKSTLAAHSASCSIFVQYYDQ